MRFIPHALKHRPLFWDALAIVAGCAFAAGALSLGFPWNLLAALALATLAYSCLIEPWIIVTKEIGVPFPSAGPLRIAFVSDFHVGPHKGKAFLRRVVKKANALRPDLVLLGGDFLYNHDSDPELLEPLGGLEAPLGVFGVMGNHDSGRDLLYGLVTENGDRTPDVERVLTRGGIVTLRNEWKKIDGPRGSFVLAGTDDVWMKSYDLGKTLDGIPDGLPVILLTHNPDAVLDERAHRADLVLSGHTHGGQVRLPWLGSLAPIPNEIGRKYDRGTFALPKETTLVVSHGVGESMARPRLFTVPEILLISLS